MKIKLIILVLMLFIRVSYAQQDSQFTQYMYNTININPAYAGSRDVMSVFALHRTQWVGLDGAPTTNMVSLNAPLTAKNVGLGLSIMNEKIGPSDENNIAVDFSYTLFSSEKYKLAFGLKASVNLLNIDFSRLNQYDKNDYVFDTNIDNKLSPNIGIGFYLYSDKGYFGVSAPKLLETTHFDKYANTGANSHVAKERLHYYFIAGRIFEVSDAIQFKPSILAKMVQGAPLQVDMSGNFLINDKVVLGVAYRWSAAVSAMVGFQVFDPWFIGYGYDLETTKLANYNSGTHEIFLRYELFNKYSRIAAPRFF